MMVTLGTGIGSALFVDGELVPNTELGHLKIGKQRRRAASRPTACAKRRTCRGRSGRSASTSTSQMLEALVLARPDHRRRRRQQEGGEVPARGSTVGTEIVPAQLLNEAGIVGRPSLAHVPARRRTAHRLTRVAVRHGAARRPGYSRRLGDRRAPGEPGVGPVPPVDGAPRRRASRAGSRGPDGASAREVDQTALGIAQHDDLALQLLRERALDRAGCRSRRRAGVRPVPVRGRVPVAGGMSGADRVSVSSSRMRCTTTLAGNAALASSRVQWRTQ